LQFVTGTCRVPVGGFAELMGKLQRDKILLKMIIDIILFHFINMGLTLMSIKYPATMWIPGISTMDFIYCK